MKGASYLILFSVFFVSFDRANAVCSKFRILSPPLRSLCYSFSSLRSVVYLCGPKHRVLFSRSHPKHFLAGRLNVIKNTFLFFIRSLSLVFLYNFRNGGVDSEAMGLILRGGISRTHAWSCVRYRNIGGLSFFFF